MDYGTLVTSNDEAHVLYFHVDEVHPDNPRPEYRHFYYVVTSSSSAQDAFLFLCRSLCEAVDQRLRRWHGLYMRWFDKISFENFLQQVRRAPKGNNERRAQDGASELTSPVLYADEASARMGLDQLLRQRDPASISEQKILTARQRSSFTPQKTAAEEVAELKKYQSGQQARNTSSGGVPTRRLKRADTPSDADNLPPPTLGVVAGKKKKVSRSKEPSIKGIQGPPMKAVGAAPQKRPSVSVSPAVPSNARTQGTAEQQLTQARDLLAKQQQDHAKELEYLHAELQALRATVRDDKVHQGDKLQELIQTNKVAVQRIEDSTRQNEEQMKRFYDEALQQRDIRIAQLSEDLIKSQYQNRLLQEESPRMERRAPASDRSASGPRRLASSSMPTTRGDVLASNLVETTADRYMAERVQQLEVQCEQHQLERHHAEEQLKSVSVQLVNLQYELERANYVIDSLKNGLQFVKSELPSLRRDLLHVPPAR